jgi:hypothetical protein
LGVEGGVEETSVSRSVSVLLVAALLLLESTPREAASILSMASSPSMFSGERVGAEREVTTNQAKAAKRMADFMIGCDCN